MQNTSQALQSHRNDSTKVTRIIAPVASAGYRPLVAVLRDLHSHDERLAEQFASRVYASGRRKIHVRCDRDGRIVGVDEDDAEDQERGDGDAAPESTCSTSPPCPTRRPSRPYCPPGSATRIPGLTAGLKALRR